MFSQLFDLYLRVNKHYRCRTTLLVEETRREKWRMPFLHIRSPAVGARVLYRVVVHANGNASAMVLGNSFPFRILGRTIHAASVSATPKRRATSDVASFSSLSSSPPPPPIRTDYVKEAEELELLFQRILPLVRDYTLRNGMKETRVVDFQTPVELAKVQNKAFCV